MTSLQSIVVHSLVCHSAIDMAVRCLSSIAQHSDRPIHFSLHDDGTLLANDTERLLQALPGSSIIPRRSADSAVEPLLARFPRSLAYRRAQPLALKLLDIPLLGGSRVAYCDTDVLAFRSFSRMFDWPDGRPSAVFMPDSRNAYALRPWHLHGPTRVRVPQRVNTGLMLVRTCDHDLDFIEWFLGRQFAVFDRLPGWIEQTCWAALAHRVGCRLYDARQVRVIRDASCLSDPDLVIGHFTTNVRGLWSAHLASRSSREAPVVVRTGSAGTLTMLMLSGEQVRRGLNRWQNRLAGRPLA